MTMMMLNDTRKVFAFSISLSHSFHNIQAQRKLNEDEKEAFEFHFEILALSQHKTEKSFFVYFSLKIMKLRAFDASSKYHHHHFYYHQ
jgi:hypothetical protein